MLNLNFIQKEHAFSKNRKKICQVNKMYRKKIFMVTVSVFNIISLKFEEYKQNTSDCDQQLKKKII